MISCKKCHGDNYILLGCCDGRECGCQGQPVSITNCPDCNPYGKEKPSDYINEWINKLEYVGVKNENIKV